MVFDFHFLGYLMALFSFYWYAKSALLDFSFVIRSINFWLLPFRFEFSFLCDRIRLNYCVHRYCFRPLAFKLKCAYNLVREVLALVLIHFYLKLHFIPFYFFVIILIFNLIKNHFTRISKFQAIVILMVLHIVQNYLHYSRILNYNYY